MANASPLAAHRIDDSRPNSGVGRWVMHFFFYSLLFSASLTNGLFSTAINNNNIYTLTTLLSIVGLVIYRPGKERIRHRALNLLSLALILVVATSTLLMAQNMEPPIPSSYLLRGFGVASSVVLVWVLMHYLDRDVLSRPETIFWVLIGIFWVIAIDGYFIGWLENKVLWQPPPYFRNIRHTAYFCAALVAPAFYLFLSHTSWKRWIAYITLCTIITFIVLTGARGASISLLLATFVAWLLLRKSQHGISVIKPLVFIAIGASLLTVSVNQLIPQEDARHLITRVAPTVHSLSKLKNNVLNSPVKPRPAPMASPVKPAKPEINLHVAFPRAEIWRFSLLALDSNTLWLGLGPDAYRHVVKFHNIVQPHNNIVLGLIEWGVIGTAIILTLLTLVVTRSIRTLLRDSSARAAGLHITALFSFTTLTAMGMLDGTYYHAFSLFFVLFFIALMLKPFPLEKAETPASP